MITTIHIQLSRKLIRYGILLFLLGIITGFSIPIFQNSQSAFAFHFEETLLSGMFITVIGVIWPKLVLSNKTQKWGFGLLIFGTYIDWIAKLMAAILAAGIAKIPLPGGTSYSQFWTEILTKIGYISLFSSVIIVCGIILWGLRTPSQK